MHTHGTEQSHTAAHRAHLVACDVWPNRWVINFTSGTCHAYIRTNTVSELSEASGRIPKVWGYVWGVVWGVVQVLLLWQGFGSTP